MFLSVPGTGHCVCLQCQVRTKSVFVLLEFVGQKGVDQIIKTVIKYFRGEVCSALRICHLTSLGFPGGTSGKEGMATQSRTLAWRIAWKKSLAGYSPGGLTEWDTAEDSTGTAGQDRLA